MATTPGGGGDEGAPPCPERCAGFQTGGDPSSAPPPPPGARIFYLILIHDERTAGDAAALFRAVRDPRNVVLVHVDAGASAGKQLLLRNNGEESPLLREVRTCPCGSAVRVESVHSAEWSKWSMNLPTLWGMRVAAEEYAGRWDVFVNLSGDSLPVYAQDTTADLLRQLPYNFVTSSSCETGLLPTSVYDFPTWWHKRRHYTSDESEKDPVFKYQSSSAASATAAGGGGGDETADATALQQKTVVTHFGSQWVILQAPFCRWLLRQLDDPRSWVSQFRDHLIQSEKLMTDETFIASVLVHAEEFKDTLPRTDGETGELLFANGTASGITDVRYERMDEHYPTAFGAFPVTQRYDVPASARLDPPRVWGPYFLGVYDLAAIRRTGALFVRKVSVRLDPNMLHLLPVDRREQIPNIQWPNEVKVIDKPNWEVEMALLEELSKEQDGKQKEGKDEEEL